MAKDREQRYASATDLLMDLDAVMAGQPPLQARKQLRTDLLTRLAEPDHGDEELEETVVSQADNQSVYLIVLIILAAALFASLMFIIVLLLNK